MVAQESPGIARLTVPREFDHVMLKSGRQKPFAEECRLVVICGMSEHKKGITVVTECEMGRLEHLPVA